ncbi:ATP-binding protein [Nonomuraea sp. NPDC050691]|uniref:ATP-binding protein n=1 Tax=Nonomuraea sp. NPDC050691 TaxID=3155661 RepID=UPI0033FA4D98
MLTTSRPHVFGRFARGDGSRSRRAGSTELGLAIVAAVADAHGGRVEVEEPPAGQEPLPAATSGRPERSGTSRRSGPSSRAGTPRRAGSRRAGGGAGRSPA